MVRHGTKSAFVVRSAVFSSIQAVSPRKTATRCAVDATIRSVGYSLGLSLRCSLEPPVAWPGRQRICFVGKSWRLIHDVTPHLHRRQKETMYSAVYALDVCSIFAGSSVMITTPPGLTNL